jgi:hypothetical protein
MHVHTPLLLMVKLLYDAENHRLMPECIEKTKYDRIFTISR